MGLVAVLLQRLRPAVGGLHGWATCPTGSTTAGADYLPWLLDQLHQHQVATGQRLLDVFTVHYYPQGGEYGSDTSTAMQLRRNRSTRSLWDPNYVDETWINDKVRLVPRLKDWVDTLLRALAIGVTEYSWGADDHINGATTQADVLGIFGREGLDLATRWVTPAATSPTFKAFQMYRNYDGNRSTFGDVSVSATGPNPDQTSVFAVAADGRRRPHDHGHQQGHDGHHRQHQPLRTSRRRARRRSSS